MSTEAYVVDFIQCDFLKMAFKTASEARVNG